MEVVIPVTKAKFDVYREKDNIIVKKNISFGEARDYSEIDYCVKFARSNINICLTNPNINYFNERITVKIKDKEFKQELADLYKQDNGK